MNFVSLVSFPSLCKCTAKNRETPKKGRAIFLPVPDLSLRKAFPGERGGGQRGRKRVQKKGLAPPRFCRCGQRGRKRVQKRACAPFRFCRCRQRVRKRAQKKGLRPLSILSVQAAGTDKGTKKGLRPLSILSVQAAGTEKATKKGLRPLSILSETGSLSTEKGTKKGLAPPFPESGTMVNPKATHRPPARLEPLIPRYPKSLLSTLCRTKMVSQIFLPLSFLFQIHLLEYHLCCL